MNRRSRAGKLVLATLVPLVLLAAGAAHADRRDEAWRRGNEAYLHGDYAGAAAAYEELLQKNADDVKRGAGQYFTPPTDRSDCGRHPTCIY